MNQPRRDDGAMDHAEVVAWITDDAAEMADLLRAAEPDQPVPSCPGWNAADLSKHIATGFAGWFCYNISTPADSWLPTGLMERMAAIGDDHQANAAAFESGVAEFTRLCDELDLTEPTWAFGGSVPARWWMRRAAVELTAHLTDASGVHGRRASTTPARHSEAIDEWTTEMFPRVEAIASTMNALLGGDLPTPTPPERSVVLCTDDTGRAWSLSRSGDGTASTIRGRIESPEAVGQGSSADVLAWLFGRPMTAPLVIDGDAALLDDWNLFERRRF
jgi:hypothetical protein